MIDTYYEVRTTQKQIKVIYLIVLLHNSCSHKNLVC